MDHEEVSADENEPIEAEPRGYYTYYGILLTAGGEWLETEDGRGLETVWH